MCIKWCLRQAFNKNAAGLCVLPRSMRMACCCEVSCFSSSLYGVWLDGDRNGTVCRSKNCSERNFQISPRCCLGTPAQTRDNQQVSARIVFEPKRCHHDWMFCFIAASCPAARYIFHIEIHLLESELFWKCLNKLLDVEGITSVSGQNVLTQGDTSVKLLEGNEHEFLLYTQIQEKTSKNARFVTSAVLKTKLEFKWGGISEH